MAHINSNTLWNLVEYRLVNLSVRSMGEGLMRWLLSTMDPDFLRQKVTTRWQLLCQLLLWHSECSARCSKAGRVDKLCRGGGDVASNPSRNSTPLIPTNTLFLIHFQPWPWSWHSYLLKLRQKALHKPAFPHASWQDGRVAFHSEICGMLLNTAWERWSGRSEM